MLTRPAVLLKLEGAAVFALSLYAYHALHAGWLLFAVLILAPDLFMLGYLVNVKAGAALYNLVHTYTLPLAMLGVAYGLHRHDVAAVALIWLAHISMDRMLGYGLKYPTFFKDTHLQRL